MRDILKTIEFIEHKLTRGLEQRPAAPAPKQKPRSSLRVWHAPVSDAVYPSEQQTFEPRKDKPVPQLTVTTRALKVTAVLDTATIATLPTPDGQARSKLAIICDGKIYTADIATKSLRKVNSTISANGAENTFVMVQGKLKGSEIAECGLVAQVKVKKQEETNGQKA
jgi:hypothetical protein